MTQPYVYELEVPASAIDDNSHVNNVEYLRWMQDAATAHSDAAGCTEATRAAGATWVVRSHHVEYLRPAFAGERIEVRTWVADFRRAFSLRKYEVVRQGDGVVLARGETNWAFVDAASGRPRSIPEQVQVLFSVASPGPRSAANAGHVAPEDQETNGDISPERILQLGLGFWGPKVLLSAVELGVFSELARGPADLATLTVRLGLHPRSARDFLDALVALGMLQRDGEQYANTPQTEHFLDRGKPSYIGGLLEMANDRLYGFWGHLTEALRTGQAQNEAKANPGVSFFDALYRDQDRLRLFLQGMTGISLGAAQVIARKFPWHDYRTFLDVGGAQGAVAVQVALANPHLHGGNFDLSVVGPIFEEYAASFGLNERLRFHPGDFFRDPLPVADVLVMGHILHDWALEQKKALIARAYEALPAGGALIVYEALIDDERRENAFGLLMSLNMLIETPGGFDYTGADCRGWLQEAGFRQVRVEHLLGPDSMVVGIK
jgi:YbgC/YbaW family acyl-CoA thioester hydrolase